MTLSFASTAALASPVWQTDFRGAQAQSQKSGRPLLIDFSAVWCGPCQQMDRAVFHDPTVARVLTRFVCVRVDIDRDPNTARKFAVSSIPRVVILNAHGQPLYDQAGYDPSAAYAGIFSQALSNKPVVNTPQAKPGSLVGQLASFDEAARESAVTRALAMGEGAVAPLISALAQPKLAVRVASYNTLMRLFTEKLQTPRVRLPPFDPWAPAADRAKAVKAWSAWWSLRQKHGYIGISSGSSPSRPGGSAR